ncbi:hypothetical protein SUGI_1129300 [Cryptomeria japonica]|uniref:WPP domain-associated protein n=1 Tax=Cryptomeria japonica TaxID=3369 RepID=UPI002414A6E1|nr:WPP domain-associated protein [Cryptomeria japonica]XP_057819641.2 WPP domain-associated protein [Cryptomeria japonica]XP_057819642.2 WPP domain-associated protein [Cryptomeria japonica]GLJ53024.1 hypothetical protein SUGI_1129300 [Cryptomeria japonica]
METHNFGKAEYDASSMNKSSEADTLKNSEAVGINNGNGDETLDLGSTQDDPDYVVGILAQFEQTQDFLEDLECRLSVSAMVSDAVTNGVANALMEETSEALTAKEAEIVALNDKLEDKDIKLWNLTEKLRQKEQELAMLLAENNSDRGRLVSDFMYDKERLKRKLSEAETHCIEKEKQLAEKTEAMMKMTSELEADRNRIIVMEEQIKNLHEEELENERNSLDLVEQLERLKSQYVTGKGSIMEEDVQNLTSKCGGQLVAKEECEAQMLRHEIERSVCESIYEGQLLELQDKLETDRLWSRSTIATMEKEMKKVKELSETKLMNKGFEVMILAEQLKEIEVANALQTSVIVGVLDSSIQELQNQISKNIQDLGTRDEQINSLTSILNCLKQECESLKAQISSNHVIDAEIENNLSTLKVTMENQCTRLKQDVEEERARVRDDLSRITKLQKLNNSLAKRLREQQISLEQVEEKLAEHEWQQSIVCLFTEEVYGSKLNEAVQLITNLNSELEKKDSEVASHMEKAAALQVALNAEKSEVLSLQRRLKGFEFEIDSLNSIDFQKVDSAFENIDCRFLKMSLRLDGFEKNSKTCFENIQSHVAEFLEKQWKQNFEEHINGLVLREFLEGLEEQLKAKELEERKFWAMQIRLDKGREALINEVKSLRQELEQLKFDEPGKSTFTADGNNSNGFQTFSQLKKEVQNGEANDGHRKDWTPRRFSTGQISTDMSKLDDGCGIAVTGKVGEAQLTKELDLSVHTSLEFADTPDSPLKILSREQLIEHFKRVLAERTRKTECILEEKTEEIYKLKRDLMRGKDGTYLKKDKELNALKKRITEITRKLDNIVEENNKLSSCVVEVQDQNYDLVCKLKDEMKAERRHLLEKLRQKENELKALSDKLLDALRKEKDCLVRESDLLKRIADLESETEMVDMMHLYEADIVNTIFKETINEKKNALNLILKENDEKTELKKQIVLLEEVIKEKDDTLGLASSQLEEIEQFEKQKSSLDLALKDCEEFRKQVLSLKECIEEKDNKLKTLFRELEQVRNEKITLEGIVQDKENMIKTEQYQTKQFLAATAEKENAWTLAAKNTKIHEEMITSLQQTLRHKELCLQSTIKDKEEAEEQKYLLQEEVQKVMSTLKRMQIQTEAAQKQYKKELKDFVCKSMDASLQLEQRVLKRIAENMFRLERSKQHMEKLKGEANSFVLGSSYYKDKLEKKCLNLQKAEEEVDALGDEVDTLLSLLEKVYVALDHYLPVLQHYPGIDDLVKLIKKELIDHADNGL